MYPLIYHNNKLNSFLHKKNICEVFNLFSFVCQHERDTLLVQFFFPFRIFSFFRAMDEIYPFFFMKTCLSKNLLLERKLLFVCLFFIALHHDDVHSITCMASHMFEFEKNITCIKSIHSVSEF